MTPRFAATSMNIAASRRGALTTESSPVAKLGLPFMYAFLFLVYSRLAEFTFPYARIPLVVGSIAVLCSFFNGGLQRTLTSRVGFLLLAFTGWLVVATPLSFWKGGSYGLLVENWSRSLMVFVMIVGLARTLKQCRRAMAALALTTFVVTIICYYFGATSFGRLSLPYGMLGGPNDLAQVLLMGLPFWLLIGMNEERIPFRRVLAAICIGLTLIVIAHTGSRSALVAAAVLAFFIFRNASLANKIKLGLAAVFLVLLTIAILPEPVTDRYSMLLAEEPEGEMGAAELQTIESTQQRVLLLRQSVILTIRNPVFGVGPGQFQAYTAAEADEQGKPAMWRETHCTYTQISSEAGLPALILYAGALLYCLKRVFALYRQTRRRRELADIATTAYALWLSLISFAVTALFSSVAYHMFFPTLAGLSVALLDSAAVEISARGSGSSAARQPGPVAPRPARATPAAV